MNHIEEIDKTKDLPRCKEIVKSMIEIELSDEDLTILTSQIMDTALFIGGDFEEESIRNLTKQYIDLGGIKRVLGGM